MAKMTSSCAAVATLALALPVVALGSGPVPEFRFSGVGVRDPLPSDSVRVSIEETFQSEFKESHGRDPRFKNNNNTNTGHAELCYSHRFALSDGWYFRLGVNAHRYDFGDNRSFAPNTLQSYAGVFALEYLVANQPRFFIESHPGVYFTHTLDGDAFDAPTNIAGVFPLVDDRLYLAAGASISLLRSYPVLPIGGLVWHVNDAWEVEACIPRPRVTFNAGDSLKIWAGGELTGGGFRVDSSDIAKFNRTTVTYYEIRAGAGLLYSGWKPLTIDFGAGWAFERKFDFHRSSATAVTDGAPYVQLALSTSF
jgi:hypothetical protein